MASNITFCEEDQQTTYYKHNEIYSLEVYEIIDMLLLVSNASTTCTSNISISNYTKKVWLSKSICCNYDLVANCYDMWEYLCTYCFHYCCTITYASIIVIITITITLTTAAVTSNMQFKY